MFLWPMTPVILPSEYNQTTGILFDLSFPSDRLLVEFNMDEHVSDWSCSHYLDNVTVKREILSKFHAHIHSR